MATLAQTAPIPPGAMRAFWEFLKEELTPYPGRFANAGRLVLSATVAAGICLTFRIPYGFESALLAFLISGEDVRTTVTSGVTALVAICAGALYILLTVWIVVDVPALHFLWNIASFFVVFYAVSIVSSYLAAVLFGVIILLAIPLWDLFEPAEAKVEGVLWIILAVFVGAAVTAATAFVFLQTKPQRYVAQGITVRLAAVQALLDSGGQDAAINEGAKKNVVRMAMRGTSTLRRTLRRSGYQPYYRAQMGGLIGLVGRLLDVAAALAELHATFSATDRAHLRSLAVAVGVIHSDLASRRIPGRVQFNQKEESPGPLPLVTEMESIVALIPESFAGSPDEFIIPPEGPRQSVFVADAFSNPRHLKFALRGCLATSACYVFYNAISWTSIGLTAILTCMLTALSTIGASRQKQILRIAGIGIGGIVIGMGSQIFILPYLDSIGGFIVLFAVITAVAAWFATSTPRLSYFGVQLGLAYYFISVSEFRINVSLSASRDRVAGVVLGASAMWLAFDRLWSAPAGVEMRKTFISTLRLMAQLSREPISADAATVLRRTYALRETINQSFDRVRALSDGVLFEFGPSRARDLQFRERVRQWQPKLRTLFLMRAALLEDRLQIVRLNPPETVRRLAREYDEYFAAVVENMADRIEGRAGGGAELPADPVEAFEQALNSCCRQELPLLPAARVESVVALLRATHVLSTMLDKEIVPA